MIPIDENDMEVLFDGPADALAWSTGSFSQGGIASNGGPIVLSPTDLIWTNSRGTWPTDTGSIWACIVIPGPLGRPYAGITS